MDFFGDKEFIILQISVSLVPSILILLIEDGGRNFRKFPSPSYFLLSRISSATDEYVLINEFAMSTGSVSSLSLCWMQVGGLDD